MRKRRPTVSVRLNAYLLAVFAKGTRFYTLNFDRLARSFKCSKRAVELAVKSARKNERFEFKKIRVGRSYAVQVSGRNPSIEGVFILKNKKIKTNTAPQTARVFKKSFQSGQADQSATIGKPSEPSAPTTAPRSIQRLAGWIARHELAKIHRAGCRTLFRVGHALNFATESLHAGHARADIADAYRYALRSVDAELGHLPASVRWEPSALVKLARRRLADGLTAARRVELRRAALRPVTPEKTAANAAFLARLEAIQPEPAALEPFAFPA